MRKAYLSHFAHCFARIKITGKMRFQLIIAGLFYVLLAAVTVSIAFGLQRAIDFAGDGNLRGLITTLVVVALVITPIEFLSTLGASKFRLGFVRDMLLTVKHHRMNFIFAKRDKTPLEDKDLSFFTADVDILEQSYYSSLARIPLHVATFIFTLGALLWINWIVTVVVIVVSLLPMLVSWAFSGGLANRKKAYSDATAEYVDAVRECIEGKYEIIAYDKQEVFLKRHYAGNRNVESARFRSNFLEIMANNISNSMGALVFIAAIGTSSYFVITGDLTFGFMIAIVQLMNSLLNPIMRLVETMNRMNSANEILKKANETAELEQPKKNITDFNSSIVIKDLGLRYAEGEYVVKNLNLTFKRGVKYAIFAPSGYGKTSIARALAMEFLEFDGAITIDGNDIRDINTCDYNSILRYVRQDPYLFSDTALNNLAFFDEVPEKEKLDKILALTRVNEFLSDDEALARPISNSAGLSGGQKQRIVLARALLHNPKILVLDEITSGIDLETACAILKDLFLDVDLTCIVITHESDERFQALFDEILRLG